MVSTSSKFESEEVARSQVEHLPIQPLLTLGHDGRRFLRDGSQCHKPKGGLGKPFRYYTL